MSVQLPIRGGADWKSRVAPTHVDALLTLGDIRWHLAGAGKAKGVLTLVNRTNENGALKLERKSGLQLLFRGRNNQRLNDTVETIGKLLTKAGLHEAKKELDEYLAADPKRNGNRISAAKLLELLEKQTVNVADESDSSDGGSRIFLQGAVENGRWSEVLAKSRDSSVSDDGPIIMADEEPISMSQVQGMMNRQSVEANASGSMIADSRAASQVADRQQLVQQPVQQPLQMSEPKQAQIPEPSQAQVQAAVQAQPEVPAQASIPSAARRPEQYAGSDLYPPKTVGRTLPELLQNANMQAGKTLGQGAFGKVRELRVQGQQATMVLKTFKPGNYPMLSRKRDGDMNEAIASYLTSKKDANYADRVNVVQPEYFLVEKGGTRMMLDPLALRALLKDGSNGPDGIRCIGLVMKKAEGQEVYSIRNQLSEAQKKQVFKGTLASVSVLNERGFVHRDIKPENAFYDAASGKLSLIDTGLMHKRSKTDAKSNAVSTLAGTPLFMHPKIWTNRPYGTEADLYASAMMALELQSPLAMKIIENDFIKPIHDSLRKGVSVSGNRFFNKERLVGKMNDYLAELPPSGGTASDREVRAGLERFKAELANPNSFSSLVMDCLLVATDRPENIDWRDPAQASQVYSAILSDPRLT